MSSPDRSGATPRRASGPAPTVAEVELPFDVEGLYELRATLAAHADRLGAPTEQVEHLLIVAGELASNAIRHGGGIGRVRLWESIGRLYCQVSDRGPGFADPAVGSTAPDPTDGDASRGIWICRNLTDELVIGTGRDGHGATVTATIPAPVAPAKD